MRCDNKRNKYEWDHSVSRRSSVRYIEKKLTHMLYKKKARNKKIKIAKNNNDDDDGDNSNTNKRREIRGRFLSRKSGRLFHYIRASLFLFTFFRFFFS